MRELAFERLHRPGNRKRHFEVREAQAELEGPQSREQQQIEAAQIERASRAPDPGDPLSPALRTELEEKFGRDLGHIRVHTGADSSRAALTANAVAFTRGAHVYLAAPSLAREPHVMAHEITHTVHQGAAPNLRFAVQPRAAARGATARHAVPHRASAPASVRAGPAKPAQKLDIWEAAKSVGGTVSSGIRSVGNKVVNVGADLLSKGKEAVFSVIREIAPEFLDMFQGEGIVGFVKKLAERAFRSLFDGLMAPLRKVIDVDALQKKFSDVRAWVGTISAQLAKGDCSGVLSAAKRVGEFFSKSLQPVVDAIKSIGSKVGDFFDSIWNSIGAPVFEMLKKVGGDIWNSLTGFMKDVGKLLKRVREALGSTWTSVKGWLGIKAEDGEGEGGGLWNWVKDKAKAAGNWIQQTIGPALGPLRKVGGVMLLLAPGGQLLGIMLLWPELKAGYEALSKKWDDLNLLPRARDALVNQILPRVMAAAESVGQKLIAGADWLLERMDEFHGALASVAQVTVGILSPMKKIIDFAREQSHKMIQWAREKLKYASTHLHSLLLKFVAFMGRVGEALKKLIAAVVNPFGIVGFLAGTIWLALPECLKGPIIEFLLDVLEAFIKALPSNPLLGLLWPVMKAALTGFVKKVRQVKLEEKIQLADKIAKIISGQSFEFAMGYLKGIVLGIWEELTAPFRALAAIFDLPEKIKKFLNDLGTSFCEVVEKIRCFLATLAQSFFGKLDELLGALQEYLENPSKILDLISCAAQGILTAATSLGETLADEMIKLFRGPEGKIGEVLGKFTGSLIVQAVISFFTAGVGAGVSIAAKVANMLGSVGKAIAQVVKFIAKHVGQFIKWVKSFIARIGKAIVSSAKAIFGRMKGFFGKIFAWFKKLFSRLRKKFGKGSKGDTLTWLRFKASLKQLARHHKVNGITRGALSSAVARLRTGPVLKVVRFARVALLPRFFRPFWVVKSKRRGLVRRLLPAFKVDVLQDRETRWPRGVKRVLKRIKKLKSKENNEIRLKALLAPIAKKWHFTELTPQFDAKDDDFDIYGSMSPRKKVAQTGARGLHAGTSKDPIPMLWYKPRDAYLDPITVDNGFNASSRTSVRMVGNVSLDDRFGTPRRLGITAGNDIKRRKKMKLTGTPAAARARPESSSMGRFLASLNFSLNNRDIDHVRDLAFGGQDAPENLWPLRRSTNQIASTQGNWYSKYRIAFKFWVPGKGWEKKETTIGQLHGKYFCVGGFKEGVPPTGGKGSCKSAK